MKWADYEKQLALKNMTIVQKPAGGLLQAKDVIGTQKFLIYKDSCEIEELPPRNLNDDPIVLWKIKVQLSNGEKKLASVWPQSQTAIIEKWGDNSADWVGFTLEGYVKGEQKIITFVPSDLPRQSIIDPNALTPEEKAALQAAREREMEKPPFESEERNQSADKF